jgi:hypothetical protein
MQPLRLHGQGTDPLACNVVPRWLRLPSLADRKGSAYLWRTYGVSSAGTVP